MNLLIDIGIYGTMCKQLGLEFRCVPLRAPSRMLQRQHFPQLRAC
jgi:hypothetical protein